MSADVEGMTSSEISAALRELILSRGWALLEQQIAQEWGPQGYGRRMQEAISSVAHGPDRAYEIAAVAERVEATARAVEQIRRWPGEQIKTLSPEKPKGAFAALRRSPARA